MNINFDKFYLNIKNAGKYYHLDFLRIFNKSLEKLPKLESNTENQAKVVDHIKGLLSDIVTNTIVDDEANSKHKGGQ